MGRRFTRLEGPGAAPAVTPRHFRWIGAVDPSTLPFLPLTTPPAASREVVGSGRRPDCPPLGPATPSNTEATNPLNMEACHDAIHDPDGGAVAHDAVDHTRRTERAVAGSTPLSAVRRFTLIPGHLFGSSEAMMTLTKTDKRDTVNGDCGYVSLSSSNRRIAIYRRRSRWTVL